MAGLGLTRLSELLPTPAVIDHLTRGKLIRHSNASMEHPPKAHFSVLTAALGSKLGRLKKKRNCVDMCVQVCPCLCVCVRVYVLLRIKPKAWSMLAKNSTTELHSQVLVLIL